jgi:hypothetical protein
MWSMFVAPEGQKELGLDAGNPTIKAKEGADAAMGVDWANLLFRSAR